MIMEVEDRDAAHPLADRIRRALESSPMTLPSGVILPVT